MNEATPSTSRRRWVWVSGLFVLLAISAPITAYLFVRWQGKRELDAVRSQLDTDDPGWRMPELYTARDDLLRKLPVNSAHTVDAAAKLLPEGWDLTLDKDQWLRGPPNRMPSTDDAARIKGLRDQIAPAWQTARRLKDQPDGGTVANVRDFSSAFNLNLSATQERRTVARYLRVMSAISSFDNDPIAAVDAVRSGLNVARSIGEDPLIISQLVRMACTLVAVQSVEQVLGLCQPDAGLSELQAALMREANGRSMHAGLRGERAWFDQTMNNMLSGAAPGAPGSTMPSLSPYWRHDQAAGLRYLTAVVEDAKRPYKERGAADQAEQSLMALPRIRASMSQLLAQSIRKSLEAETRTQANVVVVSVGLACERHRKATGHWPSSLTELSREILAVVPADPCDGQPVRYKRTADGVVVYSVGSNKLDDGGVSGTLGANGDIVFRLFNPENRRLPALPPAPEPAP